MGPRPGGEVESIAVIGEPGRLRTPGVAGADLGADILVLVLVLSPPARWTMMSMNASHEQRVISNSNLDSRPGRKDRRVIIAEAQIGGGGDGR